MPPPAVHAIAEFLNQKVKDYAPWHFPYSAPDVPHPGIFQPDPTIVGDPAMARTAMQVLDRVPALKARVKNVTAGPTQLSIQDLIAAGLSPEQYGDSNLNGETTVGGPNITLNPSRSPFDQTATLMHEFTHVAGSRGEEQPQAAKTLWLRMLLDKHAPQ